MKLKNEINTVISILLSYTNIRIAARLNSLRKLRVLYSKYYTHNAKKTTNYFFKSNKYT